MQVIVALFSAGMTAIVLAVAAYLTYRYHSQCCVHKCRQSVASRHALMTYVNLPAACEVPDCIEVETVGAENVLFSAPAVRRRTPTPCREEDCY